MLAVIYHSGARLDPTLAATVSNEYLPEVPASGREPPRGQHTTFHGLAGASPAERGVARGTTIYSHLSR
jgi:hypothetical protein